MVSLHSTKIQTKTYCILLESFSGYPYGFGTIILQIRIWLLCSPVIITAEP